MFDAKRRAVALLYGVVCHVSFAAGIGAMIGAIYFGLLPGRGPLHGSAAVAANLALALQFALLHSMLLSERGHAWLARMAPLGLGEALSTTTFATISSWQLLLTFAGWSPIGPVLWQPHGWLWAPFTVAYAASWLFLLRSMYDAGLPVQTGFLGWSAVVRGREPRFAPFVARGTFRFVRQPIYLAFTLTLWTGPVWTPDRLLLATGWTLYCLLGPLWKERRYLRRYGARYQIYRERVPYWVPSLRALDPSVLEGGHGSSA